MVASYVWIGTWVFKKNKGYLNTAELPGGILDPLLVEEDPVLHAEDTVDQFRLATVDLVLGLLAATVDLLLSLPLHHEKEVDQKIVLRVLKNNDLDIITPFIFNFEPYFYLKI